MDDRDVEELQHIAQGRASWKGTQPPYDGYAKNRRRAYRLVRLGLLNVERFSEHVRGERRFYWAVFGLTSAGRNVLLKRRLQRRDVEQL